MLVSRKTLQKYIDISQISDDEIAHRLTFAGIEVEEHYPLAKGTKLVVGQVKECKKLENSDHLSHCLVDLGEKLGLRQIVCGAPNVREGLKVIVAQVGAELPELIIKPATIKGVPSEGMICSLKELGVADNLISPEDETGIHELGDDAVVGSSDVFSYLDLDDTIFDIHPLANRPDMLAVFNIVAELGALFALPYIIPTAEVKANFKSKLSLKVESAKVSSFNLVEVNNINVGESSPEIKRFLLKHGQRPINNIVDIGNYVMLLTGRPLHMYDLDQVSDEKFIVSDDTNYSFVALDEKEYALKPNDQVIHDGTKVLCLGGVMGGLSSSVNASSKRIAVEVALFDATLIRNSVTRLNLPSEASSRFSKGVNPNNDLEAMNLALSLIKEANPEAAISEMITYKTPAEATPTIIFDAAKINKLLGTTFTREEMVETLSRLNIIVNAKNEISLPSYRQDMTSLADIAEEVIRVKGFNHVTSELPNLEISIGEYDETQKARYDIRKIMRNFGLYETLSYSLVSKEQTEMFKLINKDEPLALEHPMTPLRAYLRINLLPSILETLSYNVSRQAKDFSIFEISNITSKNYVGEHLSFAFYGKEKLNNQLVKRDYDFYDAKGLVASIFAYLGISETRYELVISTEELDGLHPKQSAVVRVAGKNVGVIGKLHPTAQKAFNLNDNTIVGELNLTAILAVKTGKQKVNPPAKFPFVSRDLALLVDKNVTVGELHKVIKAAGGKLIVDINVFDVYTKLQNTPDKKSVAIKINLQDAEKTLVENEIKEVLNNIVESLKLKLNAEVRS